jgi:hypothetical protein
MQAKDAELAAKDAELAAMRDQLLESQGLAKGMKSIVQKAALRPTTTTSNQYNILQHLSPEPIDMSQFPAIAAASAPRRHRDFVESIRAGLLEDEAGKPKLLCTDSSRATFSYMGSDQGDIVADPMLEHFRDKLRAGAKMSDVMRDVRRRLQDKHGDDHDGYEKEARRAKLNLQFESKFARDLAKRTYIRSRIVFEDPGDIT